MIKRFAAIGLLFALSGCGVQAAIQGAGNQIGPTVGAVDDAIYSVAIAKYKSAQMFKAQIDGNLILPPLPAPVTPMPPPTLTPPTPPAPGGPIVTPNRRHVSTSRRRFDFSGSTFKFDANLRPVPLWYGVASIQ
jgi:hypothetical protein